jgi:hypothetical protein
VGRDCEGASANGVVWCIVYAHETARERQGDHTAVDRSATVIRVAPRYTWDLRRRTGIIPVPAKDSHTHTRITVTPERALVSVGEWPLHIAVKKILTASLPKRFRNLNGRFTSETAVRRFRK